MRRRDFIKAIVYSTAACPVAARAQQGQRTRRIAILMPFLPTNDEMQTRIRAFREELGKRGWTAGVNAQFDERWTSDNMDLIRSAAANLVELDPDAILAVGGRVIPILMERTHSIPIVNPGGSDPIGLGYAESLGRPGRNVTGFSTMELSVISKMLQTLKDIAPKVAHVCMIYNPDNPTGAFFARAFESASTSLGIEPTIGQIHGLADIEGAVAAAAAQPSGGIFVPPDVTVSAFIEQTVAAVARYRLPSIYSERVFVRNGGLVYYGADRNELYRGAASYVDRILRGEKVGDLPYQQPTKYELVINLKTAKALGLNVPQAMQASADEVIE